MNTRRFLSVLAMAGVLAAGFLLPLGAGAAKIYHCRAYVGGEFFSNGQCGQQKAAGVGVYDVPDGMPFDQQVDLVKQRLGQSSAAQTREDQENSRSHECAAIERQLKELSSKYTSWRHVPVEEVNADQAREWQLKQRRSSLRCY